MTHKNNKDKLSYKEQLEIATDLIYSEMMSPVTIIDNNTTIDISPPDLMTQHYKLLKELESLGESDE